MEGKEDKAALETQSGLVLRLPGLDLDPCLAIPVRSGYSASYTLSVPYGDHAVTASFIGCKTTTSLASVSSGTPDACDFTLEPKTLSLMDGWTPTPSLTDLTYPGERNRSRWGRNVVSDGSHQRI